MTSPPQPACVSVLYDGSCPLCAREIRIYQNASPIQPVAWVDVSVPDAAIPAGTTQAQLMSRFHVVSAQGELLVGARAFVHLWQQLPRWRLLARIAALPGAIALMDWIYLGFLRIRPRIQRWAARKDALTRPDT